MRGKWAHVEPDKTQPCPPDNTSGCVTNQVILYLYGQGVPVIHPEAAMEVAAWFSEGANGFAQFASTGAITEELLDEVEELRQGGSHKDIEMMEALQAYLMRCRDYVVISWAQKCVGAFIEGTIQQL